VYVLVKESWIIGLIRDALEGVTMGLVMGGVCMVPRSLGFLHAQSARGAGVEEREEMEGREGMEGAELGQRLEFWVILRWRIWKAGMSAWGLEDGLDDCLGTKEWRAQNCEYNN
jgi:hypothetical protein